MAEKHESFTVVIKMKVFEVKNGAIDQDSSSHDVGSSNFSNFLSAFQRLLRYLL